MEIILNQLCTKTAFLKKGSAILGTCVPNFHDKITNYRTRAIITHDLKPLLIINRGF